jgi:hypothetical protein
MSLLFSLVSVFFCLALVALIFTLSWLLAVVIG